LLPSNGHCFVVCFVVIDYIEYINKKITHYCLMNTSKLCQIKYLTFESLYYHFTNIPKHLPWPHTVLLS
jgi:hypothetical protein